VTIAIRTNGHRPPDVPLADIDLGSWDFWRLDDDLCDGAFATLRREAPISFFPQLTRQGDQPGRGHWALTRYEDVHYVSRHPEIFSSVQGIMMTDTPPALAEQLGSMLLLDDPQHQRLRTIVSRAFTPNVLARMVDSVRDRARRLVSAMVTDHPDGHGDLVADLAGPLPLQVICDMMGIPEEDHDKIFGWTNVILGYGDPDLYPDFDSFAEATRNAADYAHALAEDRRRRGQVDLTTSLVQAEVNGEHLTSAEIASFFILLVVAGSETTRNAISHGVLALTRHPDQRQLWWNAFDELKGTAVEEIVRWASPVRYMRRTVTQDTELRGTRLAAGDKVSMWYASANRDEAKFPDPYTFDVARGPNSHLGYGGGGVHFCLGANLARREITVAFEELHRRLPDIVATAEPVRLISAFIHGIVRLPVSWTPPC
jgi:cytochrome P450